MKQLFIPLEGLFTGFSKFHMSLVIVWLGFTNHLSNVYSYILAVLVYFTFKKKTVLTSNGEWWNPAQITITKTDYLHSVWDNEQTC